MSRLSTIFCMLLLMPCLLAISGDRVTDSSFAQSNEEIRDKSEIVITQPHIKNQLVSINKPVVGPELPVNNQINKLPRLSIPSEAVAEALSDAINVQKEDPFALPFTRWLWVQSGEVDDFKALSNCINKISRGEITVRPVVRGVLARIDLRWYAGSEQDLKDWLGLWEQLQFDPWFSTLITKDTLKLLTDDFKQNNSVQVFKTKWVWDAVKNDYVDGGKELAAVKISNLKLKDVVVVRTNAYHLKGSGIEKLQLGCNTIAPIVDSRYFTGRVLSTHKDKDNGKDNLFSTVWGGLYYEFAGIRTAIKGVKTDFDQLLIDLETSIIKDEGFQKYFDRLRGKEAAGLIRSDVTGKRRRIIWFPIGRMRLTQGVPAIFITEDVRDRDLDTSTDSIMNLVDFKPAAYEVIFTKPNGEQGYALFDAAGKLLEEGAIDVVTDSMVPAPYPARLQSAISCIRCHGPDDGWKPFVNDVKKLLSKRKLDVFGDTSKGEVNKPISDTVLKLAGQYEGNPTILLMRLRDDYAKSVLASTGNWKKDDGQTNTVKLTSAHIAKIWSEDRYNQVDASLALKYMGLPVPENGKEVEILNRILPPVNLNIGGIIPEDPRIAALKDGLKINPFDFAFIYSFALTRALQTVGEDKK